MPRRKTNLDPISEEIISEQEAESHSKVEGISTEQIEDEEAEKAEIVEHAADVDQNMPAELAAVSTETETARELNKFDRKKVQKAERKAVRATKVKKTKKTASRRSARYLSAKAKIEPGRFYRLDEAIILVKEVSLSKFDGAMEVHLRLAKKKGKTSGTESNRGLFNLPHGTGKDKKIIVLDEAKIEEITQTKKIDFDVALASPELMPKVAKIARILGPVGKMPDPKSGTVTTDPEKTITEINSGRVEYRIDPNNNIHQIIGRVSWEAEKLRENAQAVLSVFPKSRLVSVTLSASISPAVPVDLTTLK